jgi:hypothetical protein
VQARDSNGEPLDAAAGRISLENGSMIDGCEIEAGAGRCAPLAPGNYRFHLLSEDRPQAATCFAIRSGEETALELVVPEGFGRAFEFTHPDDGWDLRLDLTWLSGQGRLLCRDRVQWSHSRPLLTRRAFVPGDYILQAVSHAGLFAEARFQVRADDPAPRPILLELQ